MNSKSFGGGRQAKLLVAPGVPLNLSILKLKSVPAPLIGVIPSFDRADIDTVVIVPGPVFWMLPETVQLPEVRPVAWTGGEAKPTTAESKVNWHWKPM